MPLQNLGLGTRMGTRWRTAPLQWSLDTAERSLQDVCFQERGGGGANQDFFLLSRVHPRKNVFTSAALASPSLAQPFSKTLLNPSGTDDFLDKGGLSNSGAMFTPGRRPSAWPGPHDRAPAARQVGLRRQHRGVRSTACM